VQEGSSSCHLGVFEVALVNLQGDLRQLHPGKEDRRVLASKHRADSFFFEEPSNDVRLHGRIESRDGDELIRHGPLGGGEPTERILPRWGRRAK